MNPPASSRLDLVTTWGVLRLVAANGQLTRCDLPPKLSAAGGAPRITARRLEAAPEDRSVLLRAEKFVRACLQGRVPPAAPRLNAENRNLFTAQVLAALQEIPRGSTRTYGELARQLGQPRAARAVGAACGANPLPLFIPCHRVTAAHGALGGFSAGLAWKKILLAQERAG